MAVYTKVTDRDLQHFLAEYDAGGLKSFKGIAEGVENSNFLVETEKARFILTLYEKRVSAADLPFFLGLMTHVAAKGLPGAGPVADRQGLTLKQLNGRPAALITFLTGVSRDDPSTEDCAALGTMLARFHAATADFAMARENDLSLSGWKALIERCGVAADKCAAGLSGFLAEEYETLALAWPARDALPRGVIHADLFPDNILFSGADITGLIDFYFACTDFYAYDLAVCLNSWAFDSAHRFKPDRAQAMIAAYEAGRPLQADERKALPLLCRGAALRFLLTRLHDWLHQEPGALVTVKDPLEYKAKSDYFRSEAFRETLS